MDNGEESESNQTLVEQFPVLEGEAAFVGSVDFSWEEEDGAEALVFKICDVCLHPIAPLFDFRTQVCKWHSTWNLGSSTHCTQLTLSCSDHFNEERYRSEEGLLDRRQRQGRILEHAGIGPIPGECEDGMETERPVDTTLHAHGN